MVEHFMRWELTLERRIYMKISLPSAPIMHEYLLMYGEGWVIDRYSITGDEIDAILYGAAIPTEEKQKKKADKVFKEDAGKGKYRVLSAFTNDHFIWDKKNATHIRCESAEEKELPILSDMWLKIWTDSYKTTMEKDMARCGNVERACGWSLGERVINKTTSRTSDDIINDTFLSMLVSGELKQWQLTERVVAMKMKEGVEGHGLKDESLLESLERTNPNNVKLDKL